MSEAPKTRFPGSRFFRNWLGLTGAVIAAGSFFAFLLLFAVDLLARHANPYMGILAYVISPAFLILGLALIVFGYWLDIKERRIRWTIDLSRTRDRRILIGFTGATVLFLFITALGSYQSYQLTQSVPFCGQACHVPMEPQFVTYQHSPHAEVVCVACHVGPGATAYLRTKLNGVHQLISTMADSFPRPIQLEAPNQRPAQETCEQCHWRDKYTGNLLKTHHRFLADEENTPFTLQMLLKVGGGDPSRSTFDGIHWHMNLANKIEFIEMGENGEVVPWVRFTAPDGTVTEYRTADFDGDPAEHSIQTMDCMDCHNRPAHNFMSPNDAVDLALASGRINPAIPWAKQNVVAALSATYSTREEALQKIADRLAEEYAGDRRVKKLIAETQAIYQRNFFPEMKADWRAYPDHLSHKDWQGCFRCHDNEHSSTDGSRTIQGSDCNSCHLIVAQGTGDELENVNMSGYVFSHLDSEYSEFSCAECHDGALQE